MVILKQNCSKYVLVLYIWTFNETYNVVPSKKYPTIFAHQIDNKVMLDGH